MMTVSTRHSISGCHLCSMTFMLSVIHKPFCAECRYAEFHYAECRSALERPARDKMFSEMAIVKYVEPKSIGTFGKKSRNLAVFPFVVFPELEVRFGQRRRLPVDAGIVPVVRIVVFRIRVPDPPGSCPRKRSETLRSVGGQEVV